MFISRGAGDVGMVTMDPVHLGVDADVIIQVATFDHIMENVIMRGVPQLIPKSIVKLFCN